MRTLIPLFALALVACDDGGSEPITDEATDTGSTSDRLEAHGCTYETATDLTGQAAVTISDEDEWTLGHNACIIVDAGTVVTWEGDFDSHPLIGGTDATEDSASPITAAGPGAGTTTPVEVTFDSAGDYGYYCGVHTTTMTGVVYVD